ncbi:MAG: hypothetical protein Q9192_000122 [Flavoplaca navasiana]
MDQNCQILRSQLKEWEKSFALANGGKKAGREDIKQHPEIAAKYKTYNKLRVQEAAIEVRNNTATVQNPLLKERHGSTIVHTPQKRLKRLHSLPDEITEDQDQSDPAQDSPVAHRKSIGPTPQKNGQVLGLFDLLTPSSSTSTPSKRGSLLPISPNAADTPVRLKSTSNGENLKCSLSPSGKRAICPTNMSKTICPDPFTTPSKRRIIDVDGIPEAASPVSVVRYDDTPAFLRRDSQNFSQRQQLSESCKLNENDVLSWSPVSVRVMRPKPAARGLSALVKGLRELEEAKLDDELETLREIEGDERVGRNSQAEAWPKVCVKDSQLPGMPLGPDGEGESEMEDLEALQAAGRDRNGRPLKIWKKKGQKRTTRRVTIKPNTAKWKPEQEWKVGKEDESEEVVVVVEESQIGLPPRDGQAEDIEDIQTDDGSIDKGGPGREIAESRIHEKEDKHTKSSKGPKEPPKDKKRKVVNAAAHTNYRALKIRNKNSKGKGSGRFRRRR